MNIKRILREEINTNFTEKLFNKLKNFVNYHPVNKVEINIPGFSFNDKREGINITLKKDGWVGSKVREAIRTGYGATEEESEVIWNKLRIYLKKMSFIESIGWVIYEDWLRYESDPYYVNGYNIRNLDDFIELLYSLDTSHSSGDAHSNERINFFTMLDRSDFEYIHNEVLKMIENDSEWDEEPLDESRLIKKILREETEAPYGGKMSNTGLLYSKLEDLKRHGIYKGNEKYDKILKQIEDIKKSGEKYKEPKKGFFKSKIDDYKDKKRYDEMSDFEKKIYDYQKDYDNIDKRLLQYVSDFKSYYSDIYGDKLGKFLYGPKLTDNEIAKFLTKHYREDIYPKLTGLYKNKILTHGTKDYKSLDVIDIDKHITTGTGNYGHFGKGLYLTSSRGVGKHYGRTQPLVLHNIQKPFFIIPGNKNYYGSHDFIGMQFNSILKLSDVDKNIIPSEDDDNQKLLKTIETSPGYTCVGYAETIPKLDKQWEQNGKKNSLISLMSDLVNRFGISDELAKKLTKYAKIEQEESYEFASLTGSKNVDTVYSQGKHDVIVTNKNTSGEGLDRFMDAEVVVKEPTSVVSIFPTFNAIMKSDGNSIHRDLTSPNIHNESYKSIKKILREYDEEEDEESIFDKEMFDEKIYQKVFRVFDKHVKPNPDKIFDILRNLKLEDEDIETVDLESNIIYKYLTEHKDRPNSYIKINFTPSEMSSYFCDDRDYDIRKMVEGYLISDWDYDWYHECSDFEDYYFGKIDQQNLDLMKEHYLKDLEGEPSEEDFKEFVESEFGSDIGCAVSDAQYSADIDALHSDFEDGIIDYLSNFNGKLQPPVDKEGNKGFGLEYVGEVELGDIASSEHFKDFLYAHLERGYPTFDDILDSILEEERDGWKNSQYNYFLPEECISINTDRHFRYGGAGDIDWGYFNEILNDKLSYY